MRSLLDSVLLYGDSVIPKPLRLRKPLHSWRVLGSKEIFLGQVWRATLPAYKHSFYSSFRLVPLVFGNSTYKVSVKEGIRAG